MKWDYESIKAHAKRAKVPVTDLVALAPKNDPYYVGTPADLRDAEWFGDLWNAFGYGGGIHIRRMHYQIISQKNPPIVPSLGTPYENTDECWGYVNEASKAARYLGVVPVDAFVDHRNPEPHIHFNPYYGDPTLDIYSTLFGETDLPAFPEPPELQLYGFGVPQRYHITIVAEKSTMNDVLLPLCESYGCDLVTGVGELSITAVYNLIARRMQPDHPVRVLYVSDFDPAGRSMPVAFGRKMQFMVDNYEDFCNGTMPDDGLDIKLWPVVLTPEQCRQFALPRTPIKEKERRAGHFEQQHGEGATELDALEALYPGELSRILEAEIRRYYDSTLYRRTSSVRSRIQDDLADRRRKVIAEFRTQIDASRARHDAILDEFGAAWQGYSEGLNDLWARISTRLQEKDGENILDDYDVPEPQYSDDADNPLYDSGRDYLEQVGVFKVFQGKESDL